MDWLWTDALAALLVEHDRVEGARVAGWVERPEAYRLPEGAEPIELARELLRHAAEVPCGHQRLLGPC
ncbi:MAG: hypothetical protein JW785_11620 [Acidimicrobiia bacterium]|nr:hypothetical protein [Acidimicrobiia bacterium]